MRTKKLPKKTRSNTLNRLWLENCSATMAKMKIRFEIFRKPRKLCEGNCENAAERRQTSQNSPSGIRILVGSDGINVFSLYFFISQKSKAQTKLISVSAGEKVKTTQKMRRLQ